MSGELMKLPTKAELTALGDAVMQLRSAARNTARSLDFLETVPELPPEARAMLATCKRDLDRALSPWEAP